MLSTIFWVLFVGGQGIQAFPTLAECSATKQTLAAKYQPAMEVLACLPQDKAR